MGELGRFAKSEREKSGRHRIESAGVADFGRAEKIFGPADRTLRADPARLVEQEDAVDALLFPRRLALRAHSSCGGLGSLATASSMRRESFIPRSTEASYLNS